MSQSLDFKNVVFRVLVACRNRYSLTQSLLGQISDICSRFSVNFEIFAVDDGSSDGTSELLKSDPMVKRLNYGDGSLFWAKSMAIAESMALHADRKAGFDYFFIWINDDVHLYPERFVALLTEALANKDEIRIGAMQTEDGLHSYGGFRRSGMHPLRLSPVIPGLADGKSIQTFNGNLVIYSEEISKRIGPIDGKYSHALADIDYGFRATKQGIRIVSSNVYVGRCNLNDPHRFATRREAWKAFIGPKGGGNFKSLKRILMKRTKFWAPFLFVTYFRWAISHLVVKRD